LLSGFKPQKKRLLLRLQQLFVMLDSKIGILGGGQLGKMLLQKAADFNLQVSVLDPDPEAPSKSLCARFVNGSFQDFDTVYNFGKDLDLITIEIEHVNIEALFELERNGVAVYPQPQVLAIIKDKAHQKEFFVKHQLPTTPFELANGAADCIAKNYPIPFVQKLRTGGYDGKGVQIIRQAADLSKSFDAPMVIETMVNFKSELSVIVARNNAGTMATFPTVGMEFDPDANLVTCLYTPTQISQQAEALAQKIAKQTAEALQIVGLLAVELFYCSDEEIYINEIAPRPHNSGHHTIEANNTSQYEQHWRAILGLPLGDTTPIAAASMINLLGSKNHEGPAIYDGMEYALKTAGAHIHLYGKAMTKPFRKMGHITVVREEVADAIATAKHLSNKINIISK
jgi:5-(carboxyamino)imidazole ribonucleotide synthase